MGNIPRSYNYRCGTQNEKTSPSQRKEILFLKMNNKKRVGRLLERHISLFFWFASILSCFSSRIFILYSSHYDVWVCLLECTIRLILRGVCWGMNKYIPRILEYNIQQTRVYNIKD